MYLVTIILIITVVVVMTDQVHTIEETVAIVGVGVGVETEIGIIIGMIVEMVVVDQDLKAKITNISKINIEAEVEVIVGLKVQVANTITKETTILIVTNKMKRKIY